VPKDTTWAEAPKESNPIALTIIKLCLSEGLNQSEVARNGFLYIAENICIFHSGYFVCKGAFQQFLICTAV